MGNGGSKKPILGTERACKAGSFSQQQLQGLAKTKTKDYPNGCVPDIPGKQAGSGYAWCYGDADFGYPDNGEYGWGGLGEGCQICTNPLSPKLVKWWGYGRGETHEDGYPDNCKEIANPGCAVGVVGRRCRVKRTGYMGDIGSCCLAARGGAATTGLTGNVQDKNVNWGRIDGDKYTCDPDNLGVDGCNKEIPSGEVAKHCSSQDSATRGQWDPTKGVCAAYIASANPSAAKTVINKAMSTAYNSKLKIDSTNPIEQTYIANLLQQCDAGSGAGTCDEDLQKF